MKQLYLLWRIGYITRQLSKRDSAEGYNLLNNLYCDLGDAIWSQEDKVE